MGHSILAREDVFSLQNGMHLRLVTAGELLAARREARGLEKEPGERALCANACLVARVLWVDGEDRPLFDSGEQVLNTLTAEEIEVLAKRWDTFRRGSAPTVGEEVERGVNPHFDPARMGAGA